MAESVTVGKGHFEFTFSFKALIENDTGRANHFFSFKTNSEGDDEWEFKTK